MLMTAGHLGAGDDRGERRSQEAQDGGARDHEHQVQQRVARHRQAVSAYRATDTTAGQHVGLDDQVAHLAAEDVRGRSARWSASA